MTFFITLAVSALPAVSPSGNSRCGHGGRKNARSILLTDTDTVRTEHAVCVHPEKVGLPAGAYKSENAPLTVELNLPPDPSELGPYLHDVLYGAAPAPVEHLLAQASDKIRRSVTDCSARPCSAAVSGHGRIRAAGRWANRAGRAQRAWSDSSP